MKQQYSFFLIAALGMITSFALADRVSGKSFLTRRATFQYNSPERLLMQHHQMYLYDDQRRSWFDVTAFGGASTNADDLAEYFFPFGKKKVTAGEWNSTAARKGSADLIANYFNVYTGALWANGNTFSFTGDPVQNYTFQSELTMRPKQTYAGVGFHYRFYFCDNPETGFWLDAATSIERVRNDLNFEECITTQGGLGGTDPQVPATAVANMKAAFMQSNWLYGKICGPQTETRLADIQVGLGYTYMREETHYLSSYMGVIVPTGNKPDPEFLWSPVVGNGGFWGAVFGMNAGFTVWRKHNQSIALNFDTAGMFFAHTRQVRSIDLKNSEWSRYMFVYETNTAVNTSPGINFFTRGVDVHHGSVRNLNTSMTYTHCNGIQIEGGYQFYGRASEGLRLRNCVGTGFAVAGVYTDSDVFVKRAATDGATPALLSRNAATINNYFGIKNDHVDGDTETYRLINDCDLDLDSATGPGVVMHTFYGTVGRYWDQLCNPKYLGLGFSYEYNDGNNHINRWMVYGKFGLSF